ncbi:Polysaccharide biosynthesis protein [Bradyrhizobium sp.]|uniref:oligosaccharide flippase family protein n=1 Tax=Bradyrhizobium sp. TaxID=376 RepID=UPI0007C1C3CF|nr:oligosaccharide flippase family protein [Bradyrhizobium sp.]CUT11426.1 Polysaccharide biosynthesis protein [Bradyrhizobium sp.]
MTETFGAGTLTLKRRVITASVWSLASYGLAQIIRFASNLLFSRLLDPEAFGIMAIASLIAIGLQMFSDLGLKQSIVRHEGALTDDFVNTAWVLQIVRGLLLWLGALLAALGLWSASFMGWLRPGSVYASPELVSVVVVSSFAAVLLGFETTKSAEASRGLEVWRITMVELTSQLTGLLIMLVLAVWIRSVWILVFGGLGVTLTSVILGHVWLPGIANRFRWDSSSFKAIVHFGKWIFASSAIGFLALNGDRLLLGWFLGATEFGVYVIAFLLFSVVEQVFSKLSGSVAFPALSEVLRADPARLKRQYYRMYRWLALLAFAAAGALFWSADPLVKAIYDNRYGDAGWSLGILALGFVVAPYSMSMQCYVALGRPELISLVGLVRLIGLALAVPLGFHFYGFAGGVWGVVLSRLVCLPVNWFNNYRVGIFDLRQELLPLPAFAAGILFGSALTYALRVVH